MRAKREYDRAKDLEGIYKTLILSGTRKRGIASWEIVPIKSTKVRLFQHYVHEVRNLYQRRVVMKTTTTSIQRKGKIRYTLNCARWHKTHTIMSIKKRKIESTARAPSPQPQLRLRSR